MTSSKKPTKPKASNDAFAKPLGATLEGLARLGAFGGELFYVIDETVDGKMILFGRETYDIEILGRAYNQLTFWGVPRTWDAPTVDQHPIVLVDSKGMDPAVVATNLPEFLGRIAGYIQRGRISVYLTYSFCTLLALLFFVR